MLREYALIADGERGALTGPRGDISWLCLPQWHDDPAFSDLLGGAGRYAITPAGRFVWGGHYEPGTLIWRSRGVTADGIAESRDALARPASARNAVVLRRLEGVTGTVQLDIELDVRSGGQPMTNLHQDDEGRWTARSGALLLRWTGAADAEPDGDGVLRWSHLVPAGERHDLVLEVGLDDSGAFPDPGEWWSGTAAAWAETVPDTSATAAARDAAQAYAVLRGLTSASGGMVAAATMGLPERAERGRGYDYRYVWIRDQCYAGTAAAAYGPLPALTDAVSFATARLLADGDAFRPAYRVDGGPVPDEHLLDLPGYPGGQPKAGNWVNQQFQLDAVGELLQLLAAAARHDALDADGWRAAVLAVDLIEKKWNAPEAGIWELTDDWWTHSRLAAVAGLRQIAQVSPTPHDAARAETLADAVLAETSRRCLHRNGWWQHSPTLPGLLAEEFDVLQRQLRGNLPQAFVHALLLETAQVLTR